MPVRVTTELLELTIIYIYIYLLVGYDHDETELVRSRPGHSLPKHCPSVPVRGVSSLQQPWPRIDLGSDAERPNAAWPRDFEAFEVNQPRALFRNGHEREFRHPKLDSNIWGFP